MTPDQQKAVQALISIEAVDLEMAWSRSPVTIGGSGLGLSVGSRDYGIAYINAAGDWLAAANQMLGSLQESDPDPLIDQLGRLVDLTVSRRTKLFDMGLSLADPLVDASREFVDVVKAKIKAAWDFLSTYAPTIAAGGAGILILIVVAALTLR